MQSKRGFPEIGPVTFADVKHGEMQAAEPEPKPFYCDQHAAELTRAS